MAHSTLTKNICGTIHDLKMFLKDSGGLQYGGHLFLQQLKRCFASG